MADRQKTHRVHAVGKSEDQHLSGDCHDQTKFNDVVQGLRQDMQLLTNHLQRLSTSHLQSERNRINDYQNNILYQKGDIYNRREWPWRGNEKPNHSQDWRQSIDRFKAGKRADVEFGGRTSTRTETNKVSIRASKYGNVGDNPTPMENVVQEKVRAINENAKPTTDIEGDPISPILVRMLGIGTTDITNMPFTSFQQDQSRGSGHLLNLVDIPTKQREDNILAQIIDWNKLIRNLNGRKLLINS
ncbi:hypothetical protein SNE40_018268 [Patella caerulea]|uniref:Uncharacterized protein n=1 Tax=Patella caerulea TaxID=87958 RepID=A0AAN8JBH1_PATCE